MKLSEMNTVQLADCLCDLAEPVASIMNDKAVIEALKAASLAARDANNTPLDVYKPIVARLLPGLLKTRRKDTFAVIAALTGKTIKEIETQNGFLTIKEARESWDEELRDFFAQARA